MCPGLGSGGGGSSGGGNSAQNALMWLALINASQPKADKTMPNDAQREEKAARARGEGGLTLDRTVPRGDINTGVNGGVNVA